LLTKDESAPDRGEYRQAAAVVEQELADVVNYCFPKTWPAVVAIAFTSSRMSLS
jgi:hypothetical protein